jgi:hypothetical protein
MPELRNCVLAFALAVRAGTAHDAEKAPGTNPAAAPATVSAPSTLEKRPAARLDVSYHDGQLRVKAHDTTMAELLTKVAAVTGARIDLPVTVNDEKWSVVDVGPGPAREIVGELLKDTGYDYLIQAADKDRNNIQSVMLIARDKKHGGPNAAEVAVRPVSPYARSAAAAAEAPKTENATQDVISITMQTPSTQAEAVMPEVPAQPDRSHQVGAQSDNSRRTAALSPPPVMSSDHINTQLQQMYQQRVQMIQQEQGRAPGAGNK